jgi:hypothetical protein
MDIGRSFKYMFDDESWITKILIGGILGLIPIVNFVIYGYQLEVIKNVAQDQDLPLPDWDDFGGKFVKGLMVMIASFIYSLPLILVGVVYFVAVMVIGGGAASTGSDDVSGAAGGAFAICTMAFYCIAFLYGIIVYGFIFIPGMMRYAQEEEFGAFFKFGENLRVATSNLGGYIVMLLVMLVAGIVAELVGVIACGIGILFTLFWSILVSGHLFGQYWKENKAAV